MSDTTVLRKKTIKQNSVSKPHDNAFYSAMSDLRVARDFLEHHLPAVVREKIDFNTLRMHPTTFVDPQLRKLVTDVLYSAEFKDGKNQAFLYVLIEHQSTPDKLMPLRTIEYTCRILNHYTKQHKPGTPLPVVIPLVFYNGNRVYPYSCSVFDLFGEHSALAKQFMFDEFKLVDLNQIPDEEIRQHQWSGLLETLFKHATARDIIKYLDGIGEIVNYLVKSQANDYLMSMIKYMIEKSDMRDRSQFYDWVHHHLSPPLEEETMTLAEQLRREGREEAIQQTMTLAEQLRREGREEGREEAIQQTMTLAEQLRREGKQEGRQEGKLEGEQTLLMKLLHRRFPNLARHYEMRVKNARAEELLLWGERILDAKSVDEIFAV